MPRKKRRVCFVTGTRAEFGLMRTVLEAIKSHPKLKLQIVVTGMHLHSEHGRSIDAIRKEGWKIDAVVPWNRSKPLAEQTGLAMAGMARAFNRLESDIVLVTGDRVEVFAAASAGHVSQRIVAHVHGGDRAMGQIDDSVRHAVSKLAHVHFPATASSAKRLLKLGEDRWRIHPVGSPGIDGISTLAANAKEISRRFPSVDPHCFALIVLHPISQIEKVEFDRAKTVLQAVKRAGIVQVVAIYPNNDPGCDGIIRCWGENRNLITHLLKDTPRSLYLGLLRDAAVLVGNSSSGIIEAASFGTPVVDIGPRQQGRDRCENVTNVPYRLGLIRQALRRIWNNGHPRRWRGRNVYGGQGVGRRMAAVLASLQFDDDRLRSKLIAY
jgi:UDP-N-acetylglucosamine 2-epimerase (non-hydrolysing)/GDP/UDP-N,N'-diacetylbacillosamine 2-epimerase (hydrolysing)